jgi:hypothetical protein
MPSFRLSPVNVSLLIPNVTTYVKKFKDLRKLDLDSGLRLKDLQKAMLREKDRFDAVLANEEVGLVLLPFARTTLFQDIFIIAITTVVSGLCLFCIILAVKLRTLSRVVASGYMVASTLPSVRAGLVLGPLPTTTYLEQDSSPPGESVTVLHHSVLGTAAGYLLMAGLLFALFKCCCECCLRRCRSGRSQNRDSQGRERSPGASFPSLADFSSSEEERDPLALLFISDKGFFMLPFGTLPFTPSEVTSFVPPNLLDYQYECPCLGDWVTLKWAGRLSYQVNGKTFYMSLPSKFKIPFAAQRRGRHFFLSATSTPVEQYLKFGPHTHPCSRPDISPPVVANGTSTGFSDPSTLPPPPAREAPLYAVPRPRAV